jgi:HTH-like domain
VSDKYAFIDAEYAAACAPTIERMCRWLQVSKSGYYEWLNRPPSATTQRRQLLKIKIQALFEACDGSYGYRRLHAELVRGGEPVGSELVRELMRQLGLVACQPRPWRTTTVQVRINKLIWPHCAGLIWPHPWGRLGVGGSFLAAAGTEPVAAGAGLDDVGFEGEPVDKRRRPAEGR